MSIKILLDKDVVTYPDGRQETCWKAAEPIAQYMVKTKQVPKNGYGGPIKWKDAIAGCCGEAAIASRFNHPYQPTNSPDFDDLDLGVEIRTTPAKPGRLWGYKVEKEKKWNMIHILNSFDLDNKIIYIQGYQWGNELYQNNNWGFFPNRNDRPCFIMEHYRLRPAEHLAYENGKIIETDGLMI
jgi:hypothetical protein